MKDKESIIIKGITYIYETFYDRLKTAGSTESCKNEIRCPKCKNDKFTISYGTYECTANCNCGHSMIIYDG